MQPDRRMSRKVVTFTTVLAGAKTPPATTQTVTLPGVSLATARKYPHSRPLVRQPVRPSK